MRRTLLILGVALLALLAFPALAFAQAVGDEPLVTAAMVWAFAAGAIAPLLTYVFNFVGPQVSEPVKAFVFVVGAGIAGGITQAIDVGGVGLNELTGRYVAAAVFAAIVAHAGVYVRGGINTKLGGGRNR